MTVNTSSITSGPYTGDNTNDTYDYTFRIEDKSQVAVYETDDAGVQTLLTVDTDYTVNAVGIDGGDNITRVAGNLPTDYEWYIRSDYDETQLTEFDSQGGYFSDIHESMADKLTFLIQQITDRISRSIKFSDSYSGSASTDLPVPEPDYAIGWNLTGDALVNIPSPGATFSSNIVLYTPPGAGAVETTVQTKLRESVSVKDFGATGDGITDDTAAIQAALDTKFSLYFPQGVYMCNGLLVSFTSGDITRNINMDNKAVLMANANNDFVLTVDGEGGEDEGQSKIFANYLNIDGNEKQYAIGGLCLKNIIRSKIGAIDVRNIPEVGVHFAEAVKEVDIGVLRTYRCGSTTSATVFKAAVSISSPDAAEANGANNITVGTLHGIYNYGPDVYIDGISTATAFPRKLRFNNFFLHGNTTNSDNCSYCALTTAEQDNRHSVYIGANTGDIIFGTGIINYAGDLAEHIIMGAGLLGGSVTDSSVTFQDLFVGNRYNGDNYHGITQTEGTLYLDKVKGVAGFNGFNIINASSNAVTVIDYDKITPTTGEILTNITANSYTPVFTDTLNITTILATADFNYSRVGDYVNVIGTLTIDPAQATSADTLTAFDISLPVGNLQTNNSVSGNIAMDTEALNSPTGVIRAVAANNTARAIYTSNNAFNKSFNVNFSYVAKMTGV